MSWIYRGRELKKVPKEAYGFTYKITDDQGKVYFGKKAFSHRKKSQLSKKARRGTRKRVNIQYIDSGWKEYWGSCKPLLEYININGNKGFRREILKLCYNKQSLSYWETELLIREKVLFREDCWNGHVASKYFKGKIHE